MNITKKVCIYILVGLITITGTFSSFYKGVYAFEYVGGALAFEEALKWLLASVGIISAGGMTADYWEQHGDEFVDYCTEQNITDTEVANWQLKLCEGILDKSSACWQAFKEWASTLTGSSAGGGSISYVAKDVFIAICNYYNLDSSVINNNNSDYLNSTISSFIVSNNFVNGSGGIFLYSEIPTFKDLYNDRYRFNHTGFVISFSYVNSNFTISQSSINGTSAFNKNYCVICDNIINTPSIETLSFNDLFTSNVSDFVSVQQDVTDLDIISSPLPDTDAQEVAFPLPGVSDSDNEFSADAYDNLIDQVNDGTLDLDDAITQIQDILKIIVYEQETEKIFPKPDNEENQEDLDDKINQNKDNMAFTLGGLETVFPFCIPWDIYAFMSLLRADPVPPKVELPFPNPLDPENPWIVEVDFADWDDGMRIVRLAEDFLFIIGLAVLTRSLIGAGGGDG